MLAQALFPRSSRGARAAIVVLTLALTLGLAASASAAASLTVGLAAQGEALTVTEAGTADVPSYLFVYVQHSSTPCAATANAQASQTDAQGGNQSVIPAITIPAGAYSFQQTVSAPFATRGLWVACGYLASQAYSSPGPMYHVPDAAGTSPSVIVDPCGPVPTFSVAATIATRPGPPNAFAYAHVTVQSASQGDMSIAIAEDPTISPGGVIGPGGGSADSGPLLPTFHEPPPATVTETMTVSFSVPGAQCSQPDGTPADITPAPQTFTITWTKGGGGSTSLGGVFPGPGSSATPTTAKNGVLTAPPLQKLKTILKSGVVKAGKVTASDPGTLTCNLMLGTKRLGRVTKVMKKGQTISLSFKLTAAGKRALRKAGKKPKLSVTTTFADASSHKSIKSKASVKLS